ncbi:MAG TPA: transglutaminase family protein [Thermoanaerobaculia bacterium]|nr:transglutaminase family protein [Thermoanaerobaculia bacterium]
MQMRVGYELIFDLPQQTPMALMLNIHHTRAADIVAPDLMKPEPYVPMRSYRDGFGNWCTRIVAPPGRLRLSASAVINDTGEPDPVALWEPQHAVEDLPDESLVFLLGSRYCETDRLSGIAWDLFGGSPPGGQRVQAICDYVHRHITFNYQDARPTRTAWDALQEGIGVCRDFAHLAIAFCRCMNIPARYCTGYLSDIGVPPPHGVMDFAAWLEAYLGGRWHTFDPRNNKPMIGRVLIARGRDATDVAISNTFGPNILAGFTVWADEIASPETACGS